MRLLTHARLCVNISTRKFKCTQLNTLTFDFENSTNDRMTNLNISLVLKHRRNKNDSFRVFFLTHSVLLNWNGDYLN